MLNKYDKEYLKLTLVLVVIVTVGIGSIVYLARHAILDMRHEYTVTESGINPSAFGACVLGLVRTKEGTNILNEAGYPIKCSGTVWLTYEEAKVYGK